MKVCIIGAGVAGLSCALVLERYGIVPDVFEWSEKCGHRKPFTAAMLQLTGRPVADEVVDLRKRYGISIEPINILNKMVMFSPHNVVQAKGWLGYIFARGAHPRSVERQLWSRLSTTRIRFRTEADYRELAPRYDHVVVATGLTRFPMEMGCWTDIFRTWVRGALVEGKFDPTTWICWFDKSYANNGYAYLGPFNAREAELVLVVSDIRQDELEARWEMFLNKEKIAYVPKQEFVLENIAGLCYPKEVGNIIFVGNAGGLMDSMLGFGMYNSITSGALAAEAIYEGSSYQEKIAFLKDKLHDAYVTRLCLNKFTNDDYDRLFGVIKLRPVNRLIYNSNIDVVSLQAGLLKLLRGRPELFDNF